MNGWDFVTYWIARVAAVTDWMAIFGITLVVSAIYVFARMSESRTFNFGQMFEGDNGRASMAKFGGFVGILSSTWLMADLQTNGKMSEGYFIAYIGTLVAGKVASEYVTMKDRQTTASKRPPAGSGGGNISE